LVEYDEELLSRFGFEWLCGHHLHTNTGPNSIPTGRGTPKQGKSQYKGFCTVFVSQKMKRFDLKDGKADAQETEDGWNSVGVIN
jgi:hypothetical protein